jgi:hypothetical protein
MQKSAGIHSLYFSSEMLLLRIRWPGIVVRSEGTGNAYKILFGKPDGRDPFEDLEE